jgi:hypothetical protein
VKKHAILGGFGFGVLMLIAYFLMGVSPIIVIVAGLGSGFLFGLVMFIVATAQARKKQSWDQADARANRDIMLQIVFGSVVTVASTICAVRVRVPTIGIWIFVGVLGLAKVLMSFGRLREIHGRRKLGEILVGAGIITEDELSGALDEQRKKSDING